MTKPFGRVMFCATAFAALVLAAVGAGPKGPRTLENLLVDEKPEKPPAAGGQNDEKFDPTTAEAINEAEAHVCLQHDGTLRFPCLKKLGPAAAQVLASHEHGVALDGLANIEKQTAAALAQCESHLSLNGIARLDDPVAEALAECRCTLELQGLNALTSPALAATLAARGTVHLPNLQRVERKVLEAFCTAPCDLYLPGLAFLNAHAAEVLRNHQGVLDIEGLLNPPADVLASILCNQGPIGLGAVRDLGNPAPKQVLNALAGGQGSLCLNGLQKLAVEEAKAIKSRNGRTDLDGLQVLDLATAIELRDCRSVVSLTGIEVLAPDVIKVLLLRDRNLGPGLVLSANLAENLPPHEAKAIEDHPGIQFANEFGP